MRKDHDRRGGPDQDGGGSRDWPAPQNLIQAYESHRDLREGAREALFDETDEAYGGADRDQAA